MNRKKIIFWNFFVFCVFVYYFDKLEKESKKVIYTSYKENFTENPSILFCVSLNAHCVKKTIKYGDFKTSKLKNETMKNLICHLNQNIPKNPKLIIEEAEKWNFLDAFQSRLNNTIKKDILMFDYHLCANYDLILGLFKSEKNFYFVFNDVNLKVFIYTAGKFNSFLGISFFTFNFDKNDKNISSLLIKQIKIINSNYQKVCSINKHQMNLNFCSKIYCNQQCYKKKINDHRFLYTKKDDLVLIENNSTSNPVDHECFNNCFKNFHGYYYYLFKIIFHKKKPKSIQFIFDARMTKIISMQLISKKIFFLKVTGLLNVLLGFNFLNFSLSCLSELIKISNKDFLIKKISFFIFFIAMVYSLIDCLTLIKIYNNYLFINTSTTIFHKTNLPFSISPCFDIRNIIIKNKTGKLLSTFKSLKRKNIFFLEKNTLNFKNLLNYSKTRFITNYKKLIFNFNKIPVFYNSEKSLNSSKFKIYKCFLIHIDIKQSLIKDLLGGLYLIFNFNIPVSFFYITDDNFYPNSNSNKMNFDARYKVNEYIFEKDELLSNCKLYLNKFFSQEECIDNCFVLNYLKKFKKLPLNIPIVLEKYEKKHKKTFFFDLNYSEKKEKKIKADCKTSFPLIDCYQKKYEVLKSIYYYKSKIKKNYLAVFSHNFSVKSSQILFMNINELISNILTIISVWIGINIPKLTRIFILRINKKIFSFLNHRYRINSSLNKIFKTWFTMIVFIGFLYNLYLLKNETLKQSKVTSVKYKFLTKIEYPFITICIDLKKKINFSKNLNLTGNLLDKITFSASDVFESVDYFDQNLKKKIQTDLSLLDSNKINNFLELTHFYFMKLKCFKFKYKTKIPFYYFYKNQNDSSFFTVNLKPNITKYYFTLGTKRTLNFNHFKRFTKKKHLVFFFRTTVDFKDSYTFLRDFTYIFKKKSLVNYNEAKSYSDFLKNKFIKTNNLTTFFLPLTKKYFHLTINDTKFLSFHKNNIIKLENKNIDKSFSAVHFLTRYTYNNQTNENKIKLRPNLITTESTISDKIPIEYFFLVFLNVISFWFDLSLINIFKHINILFKSIYQFYMFIKVFLNEIKRNCFF